MFQSIRPTPANAPRPQIFDDTVIARSIGGRRADVEAWYTAKGLAIQPPEKVDWELSVALRLGNFEAYKAAKKLDDNLHFPVDAELVSILAQVISALPARHREVTREWVVKSGYRVPAEAGDQIEWMSPSGEPRTGIVQVVAQAQAMAYCTVGEPVEGVAQDHVRVPGEAIYANITQARYDVEEPVLGARYEDAPGLAAAWEAAQAKRQPSPAPQGQPAAADNVIPFRSKPYAQSPQAWDPLPEPPSAA